MRIVYIKLMPGFYGGEKQTEDLIRSLTAKGHTVSLVSLPGSELSRRLSTTDQLSFSLFPYPASKLSSLGFVLLLPVHFVRGYFFVKKLEDRFHPQIVCVQEPYEKILFTPLLKLFKIKTVWLEILYWQPFLANNYLIFPLLLRAGRLANGIIASSNFLFNEIKEFFPQSKIKIIKHLIKPSDQKRLAAIPLPVGEVRHLGFAGSITGVKGVFVLLSAFNKLKDNYSELTLSYAGTGPAVTELKKQVLKSGLEGRVQFLGKQPIDKFLKSIDLLIVPSLYDNLPYIIQEAVFARVPVTASLTGGIPELFPPKLKGQLFKPGNAKIVATVIRQMIEQTPSARAKAAYEHQDYLVKHFNYDRMIEQTEDYFRQI